MRKIKIEKTIEELPLKKAVEFCIQVLKKPKGVSQRKWMKQIREDLITGKKFFRIREISLKEKVDKIS